MMKLHLLLIFLMGFCLALCTTKAMAQKTDAPVQNQATEPTRPLPYYGTTKEGEAKRIALERYQFVEKISSKFHYYPLFHSFATGCIALFPIGRSDRMYLYISGAHFWGQKGDDAILCYQRKQGRDKLVYTVNLKTATPQVHKKSRVINLLDYISLQAGSQNDANGVAHDFSYAIAGKISDFAKKDLAIKRDYVQYNYVPYTDVLKVWLLSDLENGHLPDEIAMVSGYFLAQDPLTKAELKEGQFYKKYGLPVAKGELVP